MSRPNPYRSVSPSNQEELAASLRHTLDSSGEPPDDGGMEARVAKLEADLTAIKIDVAVIKANGATKSDLADLRAATKTDIADLKTAIADVKASVAEGKSAIIMWVAGIVFLAQVVPSILRVIEKYI